MRRTTLIIAALAAATLAVAGCGSTGTSSPNTSSPNTSNINPSSPNTSNINPSSPKTSNINPSSTNTSSTIPSSTDPSTNTTSSPTATSAQTPPAAPVSGEITVLAAASLTEAFTTIGKQFKALHPDADIVFDFEASSAAAQQITAGAKADVFASASPKNMASVRTFVTAPTTFVTNSLEIAVPTGNPGHVTSLSDLAKKGVKVALCQAQVPCGAAAATVLAKAKLTVKPKTLQPDVKSTLGQVELKSVDAGLVYVTDVKAAGVKVTGITIPSDFNASTAYPIATLTHAPNDVAAQAFVAYVLSPAGQQVLLAAGFAKP